MKKFGILLLIAVFSMSLALSATAAEIKFKDVPDTHWSAKAVYDLVKLGITTGYPDGTFRGSKTITRYETAILISKVAALQGGAVDLSSIKKAQEELKAEIDKVRAQIRIPLGAEGAPTINGSAATAYKAGKILGKNGTEGVKVEYRVKTTLAQAVNGGIIKLNLDTMDAGYYGGAEGLATRLLDVEGNIKADLGLPSPVEFSVTAGPGPQQRAADAILVNEGSEVYLRPYTGFGLSTKLMGFDLSGIYNGRGVSGLGQVGTNQLSGVVSVDLADLGVEKLPLLGSVKIVGSGDFYWKGLRGGAGKNLKAKVEVTSIPVDGLELSGSLGLGSASLTVGSLLLNGSLKLADYFKTGTNVSVQGTVVGAKYISTGYNQTDLPGLNVFNKYIGASTLDIGGEVSQIVTDNITLNGKGDMILTSGLKYGKGYAGTGLSLQGGVSYAVAQNASVDATYRYSIDAASNLTYDIVGLGLAYKF